MSKRYGTIEHRIATQSVPEPNSGCLLWFGCTDGFGYGRIRAEGGVKKRVHRLVYEMQCEPIPEGLIVRHRCDTPACVNPEHLLLGTLADNVQDKVDRDRQAKGRASPSAKLTEADVAAIRRDTRPQRVIGADYGVAHSVVGQIKRGQKWRYLLRA